MDDGTAQIFDGMRLTHFTTMLCHCQRQHDQLSAARVLFFKLIICKTRDANAVRVNTEDVFGGVAPLLKTNGQLTVDRQYFSSVRTFI